jgi:hypothetical protein
MTYITYDVKSIDFTQRRKGTAQNAKKNFKARSFVEAVGYAGDAVFYQSDIEVD